MRLKLHVHGQEINFLSNKPLQNCSSLLSVFNVNFRLVKSKFSLKNLVEVFEGKTVLINQTKSVYLIIDYFC